MERLRRDERPMAEKNHRSDDHRSQRDHEGEDRDEREQEGEKVKLHEAAFFLLVIDDVERVDDRLHAGVGAPERDGESGYKSKTELGIAFCRQPRDLFVKDVDRAGGKNACGQRKMRSQSSRRRRSIRKARQTPQWRERSPAAKRRRRHPRQRATDCHSRSHRRARGYPSTPPREFATEPRRVVPCPAPSRGASGRKSAGRSRLAPAASCRHPGSAPNGDSSRSLAGVIGSGIDCPVRLADRPVVSRFRRIRLVVFAERRGNRG